MVCVAEERLPNITTVQDVVQVPGTKEQLVCGFQVLLLSDAADTNAANTAVWAWYFMPFKKRCISRFLMLPMLLFVPLSPMETLRQIQV